MELLGSRDRSLTRLLLLSPPSPPQLWLNCEVPSRVSADLRAGKETFVKILQSTRSTPEFIPPFLDPHQVICGSMYPTAAKGDAPKAAGLKGLIDVVPAFTAPAARLRT